ncbi:uncharacterized protein EV420DRAFT_606128 [Desarmillaria tabescens]|uniref:Uncharacterized protein n=1 Tax=Armillaria tabescens TaxID=1929756 RepID=A0AA39K472_ARMTA|nr:uncharacterized protein EV420DRAFT_606128 [Desarmillaria tabescens]KAK0454229.1 hypothetical protein EV420DRAFT_606128 [Desarmillaria tabescens]
MHQKFFVVVLVPVVVFICLPASRNVRITSNIVSLTLMITVQDFLLPRLLLRTELHITPSVEPGMCQCPSQGDTNFSNSSDHRTAGSQSLLDGKFV